MAELEDPRAEWRKRSYDRWVESEGVPVVRGLAVEDLNTVPVAPWPSRGVLGSFVRLEGTEDLNDAYVLELPPGSSTHEERHLYEETIYVLSGRGATSVHNGRGDQQSFEWQAGSVFTIPLNCHHRFHNVSGSQPARFVAVTLAPLYMNLFHNLDFIFNCPYDFADRFSGESGHFSGEGKAYPGRIWDTNFVPDVRSFKLIEWKERGAGGSNVMLEIGNSSMGSHISEFPVGTYKKGHRHGPGAHVIILAGEGYSLMWKDGGERHTIDWKPGSLLVPPDRWFHQHFNTGPTPARYLALRAAGHKFRTFKDTERSVQTSVKLGGDQIEYEDQDPEVHALFVRECARRGVEVHMEAFAPAI
jgi:oxalate decarboxylase/phosphoglucose isomerase-like protein (cupin superfamily)